MSDDTLATIQVLPFADAAPAYVEAGWPIIPILPGRGEGAKGVPLTGHTGWEGLDLSPDEVREQQDKHGLSNIAVRCPTGVVGIDVDAYDEKPGGQTLAQWRDQWGALPSTYVSTSRDDGVSGIRWFRIPVDWIGVGGVPGIELIQRHHRFALVAPSLHPKGRRYRWYAESDTLPVMLRREGLEVPRVEDLPWLPEEYLDGLKASNQTHGRGQADITDEDIERLLTQGEMCNAVGKILLRYPEETNQGNSCHDTMLKVQMELLRLGDQGHRGVAEAMQILHDGFEQDRGHIRDTEKEWSDALITGAAKVLANPTPEVHKGCCTEVLDLGSNNGKAPDGLELAGDSRRVGPDGRNRLDVSNPAKVAERIRHTIGKQELAGIFRRSDELVHTPRIGDEGYTPDKDENIDLGPAQVRTMTSAQLKALVEVRYDCGKWIEDQKTHRKLWIPQLAPRDAIQSAYEATRIGEDAPAARALTSVTHTPALRPDGTVLDTPGFDTSTGIMFLPDKGLSVPPVPESPTTDQVQAAVKLFLTMTDEFPFVSEDHRANWCGLAFTPLMRTLLKPPYPMGIMTAPNPGSGKGFLVGMIRALHGGVLRGEMPRDAEELRKAITSTLIDTTAPIVSFDNLTGVVRSSVLEALLTTAEWSDRFLGHNRQVTAPNDRLWLATGNNAMIGGDLARRVLFVEIDPRMPNPHLRTGFKIHPPTWVPNHRGEVLAAMLTIIRGWILDGMPTEVTRSDDYAIWQGALTGMLHWAGIPGTFGAAEAAGVTADPDQDEWKEFLEGLHQSFGDREFTVAQVVDALHRGSIAEGGINPKDQSKPRLDPTKMPGDLTDKFSRASYGRMSGFSKSLGRWFLNRAGRYAHGWKIQKVVHDPKHGAKWTVSPPAP